jgi:hypothetical protein
LAVSALTLLDLQYIKSVGADCEFDRIKINNTNSANTCQLNIEE